jgi:hypothetical protein
MILRELLQKVKNHPYNMFSTNDLIEFGLFKDASDLGVLFIRKKKRLPSFLLYRNCTRVLKKDLLDFFDTHYSMHFDNEYHVDVCFRRKNKKAIIKVSRLQKLENALMKFIESIRKEGLLHD